MEPVLTVFTICLASAFLMAELFYRLGYPRVVGQILAGVILGVPFIKGFFGVGGLSLISSLGDIGVVFLMLLVGSEVKVHELLRVSKRAFFIAVVGYVTPLVLGFLFMKALGFDTLTAVIVGICIAISAEAVTLDILVEYDLLTTTLGTTIMEAGMIDDLLGVLSLSAVIGVVQGGGLRGVASLPGEFMTFILVSYIIGFTVLPRAAKAVWKEKSEAAVFSLAVIFGLIVVLLSTSFGLSSVIGAFVAGIIIQLSIKNRVEEKEIVESLTIVTFGLIIPFFFINVGLNLDMAKVMTNIPLILFITFFALAGKMLGSYLVGLAYHMRRIDRTLLGWGMNPRGAVELVIANIARSNGLISEAVFSAVVTMTIIAAVVSPMMFRRALRKKEVSGRG
jgi:Kef-type K+ transport system membrane component KefB